MDLEDQGWEPLLYVAEHITVLIIMQIVIYGIYMISEEVEQEGHVTSLLEAKRRGISRSALRSHQPVARPVTASVSR